MLTKIDEILAWEKRKEAERDTRFVELGRYLCEARAGRYWRLEKLKSFDEFLAKAVSGVQAEGLGSNRSRGYCLEMICADFLAGANLDHGDPEMLLYSMTRFFKFLPGEQRQAFLEGLSEKAS